MYLIYNKKIFLDLSSATMAKIASITIALFFSLQTNAESQTKTMMDHNHPSVTVDLSVIYGGGDNRTSNLGNSTLPNLPNRSLLRPGNQNPKSMLHVPAAKDIPLARAKKSLVMTAPKSTLHVPPPNSVSTLQTEKIKARTTAKKNSAKPTKPAIVKPAKTAPPASKVVSPPKVFPLKPLTTTKAPKKLQAQVNQVITKPKPVPAKKVKQTDPPSTPRIKPAPKTIKRTISAPPANLSVKKNLAKQQAALPPSSAPNETAKKLRITFAEDQTKLPASAEKLLISMAANMKGTVNQRLQLMAYAGGASLTSSVARRISLSRALAIRSFLIENGVRSTRIDVRALGNKTTEKPLNRVDLKVTER